MKAKNASKPTWVPIFIDGDDEAGWVVIYQHSVTKEMRDSDEVFDMEEEALECFDNGGEMPEVYNKMIDETFGKAHQVH